VVSFHFSIKTVHTALRFFRRLRCPLPLLLAAPRSGEEPLDNYAICRVGQESCRFFHKTSSRSKVLSDAEGHHERAKWVLTTQSSQRAYYALWMGGCRVPKPSTH